MLRSLNRSIRAMLLKVSEMDEEEIDVILSAEKQLTSDEALEAGIATGVYEKPEKAESKKDKDTGSEDASDTGAGAMCGILMSAKEAL